MVMEFSSLRYFTFWSLISMTFSIATPCYLSSTTILGRYTIEYLSLLSVNCSLSYAFLYRPAMAVKETWTEFPPISSFVLWPSSPILHFNDIIVWSWIGITYVITGTHALGLTRSLPDPALYICVLFTSCSMYRVSFFPLSLPKMRKDKVDTQFLIDITTIYAPLVYLASLSYTKLGPDNWFSEAVLLTLVPASCSLSTAVVLVNLILGFRYYKTQGINSVFPIKIYPNHFLCWILMQCLFTASFRVCNQHQFLSASHTGFTSYSVVIPGLFIACTDLFHGFVAKSSMAAKVYQERRLIEIVCGMFANAVAQYYIRVESHALLLGCLFMAVAWLGNVANVNPATDFGIVQFFVSAALQCAVSLYGLHFYTFVVVAFGIAVMVLKWKMESVFLSHFDYEYLSFMRYRPLPREKRLKETRITISQLSVE